MKILIIDTHGSEPNEDTINVHARNSVILSQYLNAELYMSGENRIDIYSDITFDVVIFVHASPYTDASPIIDYMLDKNRKAKYFYVTNEYNLGQATPMWALSTKHGFRYDVIANHTQKANKRLSVEKPIRNWHIVNLNALIYSRENTERELELFEMPKNGVVYFGTFRKGRIPYFQKYFDHRLFVSTSERNRMKFYEAGLRPKFIGALRWSGKICRLDNFMATLYIEDEHTHSNYNYMANRFYEALSFNVPTFFDVSCKPTVQQSGYAIDDFFFVDSADELHQKSQFVGEYSYPETLHHKALCEKETCLQKIKKIISA